MAEVSGGDGGIMSLDKVGSGVKVEPSAQSDCGHSLQYLLRAVSCCPLQNWFSHIFTAKSSQIIIWRGLCFNFRASLAWGGGDVLVQFLQSPDSVYKSLVKKGMTFLLLIFLNRQNMKQKMDNLRGREKTEWWKHELECCDMPDIHGSYMGVLFRSIHE